MILKLDRYGQVVNCVQNGYRIHDYLKEGKTVAISLSLGNMTRYEITFVPLAECIPFGVLYDDGSSRGIQINIDRKGSYAVPWGSELHWTSLEKWGIGNKSDADCLTPFFNAVLSGGKAKKIVPKKVGLKDVLDLIEKQKLKVGTKKSETKSLDMAFDIDKDGNWISQYKKMSQDIIKEITYDGTPTVEMEEYVEDGKVKARRIIKNYETQK